jgi:RNA polymerase sigma-70 factor (ECF subfamily)
MDLLALVERIRQSGSQLGGGALEAQEELYRAVREHLLQHLGHRIPARLRSRLDAEDVLHEAFLRALRSLDRFQATSDRSLLAWIYTIAKNLIADAGDRRSALALPLGRSEESGGVRASQIASKVERASTEFNRREWVESLLGRLKDNEAEVIRLRLFSGMSFEAIAEKWRKTPGAVQRFYSRACQRLRDLGDS